MDIHEYMESDRKTQSEYVKNRESKYLISDFDDLIQFMTGKDVPQFINETNRNGYNAMINEIRRRMNDADMVNIARHMIYLGFDLDKNTTRDFIRSINELIEMGSDDGGSPNKEETKQQTE